MPINVTQGDAGHHLGDAGGHRLRRGAERDAAERDDERPGTFVYTPAAGTVLNAGAAQSAVGHLHADRRGELHLERRRSRVAINVAQGDAGHHLADAGGHRLRRGAERDAAERDDERAGTFVYTPAAGAVLNAGAAQTLSVTFTPTDGANYTAATKTVAINVIKATPVITWPTPADIVYGAALGATQLNATTTVPGTFVYTPAAGTVLNAGGAQTLSVTFTPTDAANYTAATKCRDQRHQGDAGHHLGDARRHRLRRRAERDAAERDDARSPGTFVYTPAAGTVLAAGAAQTLSVTFTPTDARELHLRDDSVAINVVKATPVITWATPADIVYGTALGATQLNATTHGRRARSSTRRPRVTVLAAGAAQTLSVTFTPTDAANYTPATTAVRSPSSRRRRSSPGRRRPTSSTARRSSATQLNATTTVPGTFVYTPAAGAVLAAGAARTLSVTFTPTDGANYTSATTAVALTVIKATPVITWPTPADIVYGTALGATQLNATTTVAGHVRLHAGRGHGPERRRGAEPVGHLHADRRGELHDRDEGRRDHRQQGDAGHHLGDARRHRLRHGARRDAAERDDHGARARSSTRRPPARCSRCRRRRCR